jgi:SMP-30/Gluconolactonase/LRE-like region
VSQMAEPNGRLSGSIAAYEPGAGRVEVLFPVGEFEDVRDWGDPKCPPPSITDFAPHGIDLSRRADGALQLLVINHGGRESVEFLDVEQSDVGLGLLWRGCVIAPDDAYFNDVVTRTRGGFWATNMMSKRHQFIGMLKMLFGSDTGNVYRYTPQQGFAVEPGSAMPFPNGIEKGPNDDVLYVAAFGGNEVRKLDLTKGEVTARAKVARPDNITWTDDGKLLVASHTDSLVELTHCRNLAEGACGAAFEVVALDPQTLAQFVWLAHRGAPIGGVSVARRVGDSVYLGSFAGDRVARWKMVGAPP